MKSLFEEMGGTYRQEGDYLIPNLALPDEPEYQIGKYGRMRRSYLKETSSGSLCKPAHKRNAASAPLPRSTKPATSVWQSSFPIWQGRKM